MDKFFTLQLLHAADQEAGIPALEDAPNFSAVLNALRDDFDNTLVLSSGDAFIPGPFLFAFKVSAAPQDDLIALFRFRSEQGNYFTGVEM